MGTSPNQEFTETTNASGPSPGSSKSSSFAVVTLEPHDAEDDGFTYGSRPSTTSLPNHPAGSLENKKKNDRTRFKERKINKMIPLFELFKDEKYPKSYVLNFPGVDFGTKMDVITVDTELTERIGKTQKISKLIEVKSEAQG